MKKAVLCSIKIMFLVRFHGYVFISTDEDPSLRIESFAIINLRGISTMLN